MTKIALGLDVSKRTIEVRKLQEGDKRGERFSIENSIAGGQKLLAWLHGIELTDVHVCLEPTGKYSRTIAAFLHDQGIKVSQVNSFTVLHYGRAKGLRNKTDKIDARLLAEYCLKQNPPIWEPPAPAQAELNEVQARLDDVKEMLAAEENRLKSGGFSEVVQKDIQGHIAELQIRKKNLEAAARDVLAVDAMLQSNFEIINSIIGIGEASAIALLATIRFEQFTKPRSVGCFAGLTPQRFQTGVTDRPQHISRRGSDALRRRLYFPALVAMEHNPQLREFADRLRAKGKPPKVVIAAVMRKMLVLAATLIRKQQYYDCNYKIQA
jgi:transposase